MKETLKTVLKALKEIEDYTNKLGYKLVVNQIDLDRELVTFKMRKSYIADMKIDKDLGESYIKRCFERKCQYRYSTGTYVIGSEDINDCIFDVNGYQIGGVYMF